MARATATWTNTELTDWEAGDGVRETNVKEQLLQNLEHLAQTHDHSGDAADGAILQTADAKSIWYYGTAV